MSVLLFDFGGTLDTDGIHWSEKFWDAYHHRRLPVTRAEFDKAYVAGEQRMYGGIIKPEDGFLRTLECQVMLQFDELNRMRTGGTPLSPELASVVARDCFEDVRNTVSRVRPILEELSRSSQMGLVSNFYGNLEAACEELGLSEYFATMVDSTEVGIRKPDPELFRLALNFLQAPPADSTVIGDSYERDIVPAKSLGCKTIWLSGRSWTIPRDTSMADRRIQSIGQLPGMILNSTPTS